MDGAAPEPSSEELARRARAGSKEAFGALVERHEASLLRFLRPFAPSAEDCEELAQEAFVRAWRKLEHYDPAQRFSAWFFTLARNLAISRLRVRRPDVQGAHGVQGEAALAAVAVECDPAVQAARREAGESLWALADRVLTAEQRQALWLRYAEDLSAEEIGAVLDKRAVAVRVLLFRARENLQQHLETRPPGGARAASAAGAGPAGDRWRALEALS